MVNAMDEPFGTFVGSTSLSDSMKRFTLSRRTSSYTSISQSGSGSGTGSSATNESTSTGASSRPSVSDGGRRKSGLASFSSKLKRSRGKTVEATIAEHGRHDEKSRSFENLGQSFYALPAEIQTQVLAYLTTTELLSLRIVSKQSHELFQANATTITRNALLPQDVGASGSCPSYTLIDLHPCTFASTTTDSYLLRTLRRESLIHRQLDVLLTFIQTRVYMLKLTRDLECEHFAPYRSGLSERFYTSILLTQHFLETIRHLIVHSHPTHLSPRLTIDHCPACVSTLKETIAEYPMEQLVSIYQTIQLLIQHFRAATRSPAHVSSFERKLKGWSYGPPPEEHMAQLVFLGGMQELSKVNEMQGSYSKRLGVVKAFSEVIGEAVRINNLAFPDFYRTGVDPVMAAMGGTSSFSKKKGKQAMQSMAAPIPRTIRRDKGDVKTAIEARADEVPVMKSLSVRLDLLDESVLASIPGLDKFLVGPDTMLGKTILDLGLVEHPRELLSPYGFVTRLLAESYRPMNASTMTVGLAGSGGDINDEDPANFNG